MARLQQILQNKGHFGAAWQCRSDPFWFCLLESFIEKVLPCRWTTSVNASLVCRIEQFWGWFEMSSYQNLFVIPIKLQVPKRISAHKHHLVLLHCLMLKWSHLDVPEGLQTNRSISKRPQVECCKSQTNQYFSIKMAPKFQYLVYVECLRRTYWLVFDGTFFSGLTFSWDPDLVIKRLSRYFLSLSLSFSLSLFLHEK